MKISSKVSEKTLNLVLYSAPPPPKKLCPKNNQGFQNGKGFKIPLNDRKERMTDRFVHYIVVPWALGVIGNARSYR
jgi:hypothetical protein